MLRRCLCDVTFSDENCDFSCDCSFACGEELRVTPLCAVVLCQYLTTSCVALCDISAVCGCISSTFCERF